MRWYWQVVAFALAGALIILRQPGAILNAQFFIEDGHVWFAEAYNLGWLTSLLRTYSGYYQTLPRLAAGLALLVPLASAPLVMNLVGLFVQILPISILLSPRLHRWGSLRFRAGLALLYLLMPNCREINVTVTNAQWHLALVACLLVLSSSPLSKLGKCFDAAVLLLCGLTGPFCIMLLPVAFMMLRLRRERWRWMAVIILALTSAIQSYALLFIDHSPVRTHFLPLGANPAWFTRIIAGQIYLGTLLGHNTLAFFSGTATLVWVALAGTVLFGYWVFKAETEIRLFAVFAVLMTAGSLCSPIVISTPGFTAWQKMAAHAGARYWFFPTLACSWMIFGLFAGHKKNQFTELIGGLLLLCMTCGLVRDFRHPAQPDLHFAQYASKFVESRPGKVFVIPQNPHGWTTRLTRR